MNTGEAADFGKFETRFNGDLMSIHNQGKDKQFSSFLHVDETNGKRPHFSKIPEESMAQGAYGNSKNQHIGEDLHFEK